MEEYSAYECPIIKHIAVLEKKWSIRIILSIMKGINKFNCIQRELPGITPKMLSTRLKELEKCGIIYRKKKSSVAVEYCIASHSEKEFCCVRKQQEKLAKK